MNEYQLKRIEATKLSNAKIHTMFMGVKSSIEDLGLTIEYKLCSGENESQSYEIAITSSTNEYLKATISYSDFRGKANLYVTTRKEIQRYDRKDRLGNDYYIYDRYEYENIIPNDELIAAGLTKVCYNYPISQLNKEFKADKNIKLILNDILPSLKTYKKVCESAKSHVTKRINREEDQIAFQNLLASKSEYPNHKYNKACNCDFKIKGLGTVELSAYGSITITKEVSKEELLALIA